MIINVLLPSSNNDVIIAYVVWATKDIASFKLHSHPELFQINFDVQEVLPLAWRHFTKRHIVVTLLMIET